MMARLIAALAALLLAFGCAAMTRARLSERGFLFREIEAESRAYPYAVYVPRGYTADRAWPLVVFLHGAGECGTDGVRPIVVGLGPAIQREAARWPAIVLFPQKPGKESEWEQHEAAVMAMLDDVRRSFRVDPDRIYLTGLSQGGHGTWVLGARHPDLWAALVPVCGYVVGPDRKGMPASPPPFRGSPEELAQAIQGIPVWAFHGDADDVVPVEHTRAMAAALEAAGAAPKVTIYAGVNHNSWDRAYAEEELPRWLLARRRAGAPAQLRGAFSSRMAGLSRDIPRGL